MELFGFCGAHRTGKSTLAECMATMGFRYVPVNISKMQKDIGYNSAYQDYSWRDRVTIQAHLLNSFQTLLMETKNTVRPAVVRAEPLVVMDRTPIDLIGYAMWSFPKDATEADHKWMQEYIYACMHLTNTFFDKVILVQPGIHLIPSETSAPADGDMVEQFNQCYLAQFLSPQLTTTSVIIPREITELKERLAFIMGLPND